MCHTAPAGLQLRHSGNIITGVVPLVFIVNSAQTISCSTDLDVIRLEWTSDREIVESSSNQELDIVFDPVNDTIHNARYTCMATSPYGNDERDIVIHSQGEDFPLSIGNKPLHHQLM